MKIGIIASNISQSPAGLERYLYELVASLASIDKANEYLIYVKSDTGQFQSILKDNINAKVVEVGWGSLWKEIGLFFAPKSDLYVFTGPVGSFLFWPKRSITVLYDFAYKYSGGNIVLDLYTKKALISSRKIVCISEETKRELRNFFEVKDEKIRVIYPGFNKISLLAEEMVELRSDNFFLFVGTLKERKNVLNIIKGFQYFLKNNPESNQKLIIGGKYSESDPYFMSLGSYIRDNLPKDRVVFLGRVSDSQLNFLYKKASALVYPSFIEGFGLPVLEAQDCGLPVITSNLSSLKEVARDSAVLVDPASFEAIGLAMESVIRLDHKEELIKKGFENIKRFSWSKMADEFLETIKSI